MTTPQKKLLDQVRDVLRTKHYSVRTEESYVDWITRYVRFHQLRHPRDLGLAEIEAFLSHLAVDGQVAAATQNQARSAMLSRRKRPNGCRPCSPKQRFRRYSASYPSRIG